MQRNQFKRRHEKFYFFFVWRRHHWTRLRFSIKIHSPLNQLHHPQKVKSPRKIPSLLLIILRFYYNYCNRDLHWDRIFSSPEPKAHRWANSIPMLRRSSSSLSLSSTIFKHLLLWNRLANQIQNLCGASLGKGIKSLYKWSRSHDQDGCHAQKCSKP